MSHHALEEELVSLSLDYISQQASNSLLLLLVSAMDDVELGVNALPCETPPQLAEIKSAVKSYLLRLEDLLDAGAGQCVPALEDCIALKNRLLELYQPISPLVFHYAVFSKCLSNQMMQRTYMQQTLPPNIIDWNAIIGLCRDFLESATDEEQEQDFSSELGACFPLYITRDSYFDAIHAALHRLCEGKSKEETAFLLQRYEGVYFVDEITNREKCFPEISEWIAERLKEKPADFSDEALQAAIEELQNKTGSLQLIEDYFTVLLQDLNSLMILFYLAYSFDDLTKEDTSYADLYHTVCAFISDKLTMTEKAAYLDSLDERLEDVTGSAIDRANAIAAKKRELMKKIASPADFSEDTIKILQSEEFIQQCYFGDIEAEHQTPNLPEDLPAATAKERDALFRPFLAKARVSLDTLPVATRRIAMQHFSNLLPSVFSVEETLEHLETAFDRCTSETQKAFLAYKISNVFHENGFHTPLDFDEDASDEDFLHGHDCGCGHHHHHHHHHHE